MHAQGRVALHALEIAHLVLVEDPDVAGLSDLGDEGRENGAGRAPLVARSERRAGAAVQPGPDVIAVAVRGALDEAAPLELDEDTVDRRLGQGEGVGEVGEADGLVLGDHRVEHVQRLLEG